MKGIRTGGIIQQHKAEVSPVFMNNNMGKLDLLIDDIKDVFTNNIQPSENDLKEFADNILDSIRDNFVRSEHKSKDAIRFSSVGKPNRQLWYQYNMPHKAEELHASTRIKFMFGHMIEQLVFLLIKTAGHEVSSQQEEKIIDGVTGHMDGKVDGIVVDVKSASPHSFNKFVSGKLYQDDPFGYIAQISGYADGEDEAAFIVMNKVNGHMHVFNVDSLEMIDFSKRLAEVKEIIHNDHPPERCYDAKPDGESGNMKLRIGCMYCDYKKKCWEDANSGNGIRVFKYKSGKRYLTHVEREPNKNIEELSLS
tara:strand:- start:12258 stop:13181 length:924 start_codon:yes stop_codon:yes gene_type:complete